MKQYLTFDNVMAFIKLFSIGVGLIIIIKQRAEVIIAKHNQKKAEDESKEWEKVARDNHSKIKFIADTQLKITQASKMSVDDKTDITRKYVYHFDEEVIKEREAVKEKEVNVVEEVMETFKIVKEVGKQIGLLDEEV